MKMVTNTFVEVATRSEMLDIFDGIAAHMSKHFRLCGAGIVILSLGSLGTISVITRLLKDVERLEKEVDVLKFKVDEE